MRCLKLKLAGSIQGAWYRYRWDMDMDRAEEKRIGVAGFRPAAATIGKEKVHRESVSQWRRTRT